MKTINISKKELEAIIKKSIREVLDQELMKLRTFLLPYVSQKEQKDIEKRYSKPTRRIGKSIEIEL